MMIFGESTADLMRLRILIKSIMLRELKYCWSLRWWRTLKRLLISWLQQKSTTCENKKLSNAKLARNKRKRWKRRRKNWRRKRKRPRKSKRKKQRRKRKDQVENSRKAWQMN